MDDDEIACQLLAEVLTDEGYKVDTGRSGKEVKNTETTFYDLVITDLMMPEIDGLEILKACKQVSPDTLVIMILVLTLHGEILYIDRYQGILS